MSTRIANPHHAVRESHAQRRSFFDRPRVKSGFSLRSSHSRNSTSSAAKIPKYEPQEEKEAKRLKTKTDPSVAMIEVEPSTAACNTRTTLAPIRAIQHRDKFGNPIAEPDRSNPTRSRWERPLDTIRGFEAAVDGSYKRQSQMRDDLIASRRGSYYGASSEDKSCYRSSGVYGPSPTPSGHLNYFDHATSNVANSSSRPRQHRSEFYKNGHTIYSVPDVQESYDLVNSASGSGSSADPAYSTGPSSENSSIARVAFTPHKEASDGNIDRQTCTLQNQNLHKQKNELSQALPDLSAKEITKTPIKLGRSDVSSPTPTTSNRPIEKRKSWLSRRLSKIL